MLDLDQRRTITQLRLLGPDAPNAPALSLPRLADVQASLAVDGGRAYVAYVLDERVYLATAELDPGARWRTRRLAATAPAARRSRARAAARTSPTRAPAASTSTASALGNGGRPPLATDGTGVFAGWTRGGAAMLIRAE